MTVTQLIEKLSTLPGELSVLAVDGEYGPYEISDAKVVTPYGARYVEIR